MRIIKWLLALTGVLVLLVVIAALALPLWFDPNDHRDRIITAVETNTGRAFTLGGEIEWSVFPRLSLTTTDIRLGNDPAFEGDRFLAAASVSAALDVLPLLRKEVRVGEIRLEGVQVDLAVDASGRGNWESLQERMASEPSAETPADGDGAPLDVTVDGLALVDAGVSYRDLGSGLDARLEGLDLEVAPLAAGAVTVVDFSTRYTVGEFGGRVAARAEASGVLEGASQRFVLEAFEIENEQGVPVAISLEEEATVDLGDGTAALPRLTVRSGGAEVSVQAEAAGLPDAPSFEGRLDVPAFDVGAWLREQGLFEGETRDPEALSSFAFQTAFSFADGTLGVQELTGTLDDSTLRGEAEVGDVVRFAFELDQLDVDRYLPPAGESAPPPESGEPGELSFGRIDGTLKVGRFVIAGLEATDIDLRVVATESGLRVTPVTGQLYGGAVQASLALTQRDGLAPATVTLAVDGVQAGDLLGAWMSRPVMTGTGALAADLSLADAFAADPLRGLDGDLEFRFADGALYGINVVGALRQALALANRGDSAATDAGGEQATDYSSFDFAGRISDGVLETSRFDLASPILEVGGAGRVDLAAATLDYRLEPVLLGAPEGEGGGDLGRLRGTRIPISLSGDLSSPSIGLDAAGALLSGARSRLQDELSDRLGLQGDDEEGESSSKDALRGLLRNALDRDRGSEDDDDGDG